MLLRPKQQHAITSFVDAISITSGRFLELSEQYDDCWNEIRKSEPWKSLLNYHYELYSITRYVIDSFQDRIPENFEGKLVELENGNLTRDVEARLKGYLESLPRPYFICFEMPSFPHFQVPEINLGYGVSIIDTSAGFEPTLVQPTGVGILNQPTGDQNKKLKLDKVYLRFSVNGYASFNFDAFSCADGLSKLKHFVFMGMSSGELLHKTLIDFMIDSPSMIRIDMPFSALIYNPDDHNEAHPLHLPDELGEYLKWLKVNEENIRFYDHSKAATVLGGKDRPPANPEEFKEALTGALATTVAFQGVPRDNPDADRIKAAMEWYVDAETTNNQTISYIQRCIGIETLLGDSGSKDRVTDKLSDRYAYLLGRTSSERQKFKDDFSEVYGRRSSIVHGRAAKLKIGYREQIKPKEMLQNCLTKEVQGLYQFLKAP